MHRNCSTRWRRITHKAPFLHWIVPKTGTQKLLIQLSCIDGDWVRLKISPWLYLLVTLVNTLLSLQVAELWVWALNCRFTNCLLIKYFLHNLLIVIFSYRKRQIWLLPLFFSIVLHSSCTSYSLCSGWVGSWAQLGHHFSWLVGKDPSGRDFSTLHKLQKELPHSHHCARSPWFAWPKANLPESKGASLGTLEHWPLVRPSRPRNSSARNRQDSGDSHWYSLLGHLAAPPVGESRKQHPMPE